MVRVVKFGGTSMLHIERVLDVIENFSNQKLFVVVSSIGNTTNMLKKENIEGVDPGAPENPKILKKIGYSTLITSIIFIIIYLLVKYEYFNLRNFIY